eukprot:symbB.v1.2.019260.t1/scaffold1570.1/size113886/12
MPAVCATGGCAGKSDKSAQVCAANLSLPDSMSSCCLRYSVHQAEVQRLSCVLMALQAQVHKTAGVDKTWKTCSCFRPSLLRLSAALIPYITAWELKLRSCMPFAVCLLWCFNQLQHRSSGMP